MCGMNLANFQTAFELVNENTLENGDRYDQNQNTFYTR